ncbi:MAG TPA: sigma-54 dependent transcriptional regulator [Vicinamibacterales bacterium]|nr:sigma-54 dependent transcriptional regulator [Vicinamibacterales bacterium]
MADPWHLLLVDDEKAFREAIAEQLADRGFVVTQAADGTSALDRLSEFAYDIVVTDLRLPGADGRKVLQEARARYPDIIAIVITGYGTVKDAVELIKQGASDFITKPFQFDGLLHVIEAALEQRRLRAENDYLRSQLDDRYRIDGIVGKSDAMHGLFQLLHTVADSPATVLITGETGTGKELAARAIHHASSRRAQRFVALNCSAIPETLLEAELFGHVRGAFTGAVANRQGKLEAAHRGTLFLDEVGTMSAALQAKLLRVLQEREFERVGDSQTVKVDVRVIAATHADLQKMVTEGQFREDLFYRLNVVPVRMPPLRERRDDIPLLVQHFLVKLARDAAGRKDRNGSAAGPSTASQDAMRQLMTYDWPGNVRQLENVIERLFTLLPKRAQIEVADLPDDIRGASPGAASAVHEDAMPDHGVDLDGYLSNVELMLIRKALDRTSGNKRRAADLLQIKRTTLIEKLKRLERLGN